MSKAVQKNRQAKEELIIDAAEKVFFEMGYNLAKMEDVAREAGMSKPSLYFYFTSREELYLAITLRALEHLIDLYYRTINENRDKNGYDRVIATTEAYLTFSEKHFLYHEALFNYMSIVRHADRAGSRNFDKTLENSVYSLKLRDLHNLPIEIISKQIDEGKADGSIANTKPSKMIYITNWALIAGFIKLNEYGGKQRSSLYGINLQEWKAHILKMAALILQG